MRKTGDKTTKSQLLLQRTKLKKNLSARCRTMVEFPEYVGAINKLLRMKGLRKEFQGKNFEVFVRGRTIEFNVALLEDMYESWHRLACKSVSSVDERPVQVVSKWNRETKREDIKAWFNESGDDGIFPNVNGEDRERLYDRAVELIEKGYELRTFK